MRICFAKISKNQKVLNNNHQDLSVYGIGTNINRAVWKIIGDRLLEIEALKIGEFKALKLTNIAKNILKSIQKMWIFVKLIYKLILN